MFPESDLLPISALQHLLFCERQCALIHIEGLWAENRYTVEGRHLHEKAHDPSRDVRRDIRIARGLAIRSFRLGLSGIADVVEFHPDTSLSDSGDRRARDGPATHIAPSGLRPFPVEYKRGRPKSHDADRVQLCAQALCLEEMLNVAVTDGALFYGRTRRRKAVKIDEALRSLTDDTARRLHALIASGVTPRTARAPKCNKCSMLNLCLPDGTGPGRSASRYLQRSLAASASGPASEDDDQ
ncbi:MAG: CRISPR-associated protein Cas4 [Planctomycetes bacterium]|nr:CRISPR-associated protein Cas4 [Planctomycetota bacterium]NOG53192.1 CRISPR-associated protein Cas4 [Planctomycetota bacterium]